jgi:hypothetical protein
MSSKATKKTTSSPAKRAASEGGVSIGNTIGLIVVALVCALALWGIFGQGSPQETTARPIPASQTLRPATSAPSPVSVTPKPTRTGTPWEYDAATNHHWDPRPGHEHWHQGQPPPEDQRAAGSSPITSTVSPIQVNPSAGKPERDGAPWEYDAETNFHWDPRPGHEHWHQGQPPPEDQR